MQYDPFSRLGNAPELKLCAPSANEWHRVNSSLVDGFNGLVSRPAIGVGLDVQISQYPRARNTRGSKILGDQERTFVHWNDS
jgi:hypothetical protein